MSDLFLAGVVFSQYLRRGLADCSICTVMIFVRNRSTARIVAENSQAALCYYAVASAFDYCEEMKESSGFYVSTVPI